MAEKTSTGRLIAAGGGIVLIISLFLSWYGVSVGGGNVSGVAIPGASASASGWDSLDFADILFFIIGLLAILPAALDIFDLELELPIEPGTVLTVLGGFAVVWTIFRIIDKPGGDTGGVVDIGLKYGIFVALIGAALVAFGGFTQRGEEESPDYASATAPPAPPAAAPPAAAPPAAAPPAATPPPQAAPPEAPPAAAPQAAPPAAPPQQQPPVPPSPPTPGA